MQHREAPVDGDHLFVNQFHTLALRLLVLSVGEVCDVFLQFKIKLGCSV